jgi:protein-disulfide isomerase
MSSTPRPTKNERRDAAREKAKQQRVEQQRRERRRRWILQGSVGLVVVALVAVVAVIIVTATRPAGPGPKNMAAGGITITGASLTAVSSKAPAADAVPKPTKSTDGKTLITVFEDFGCPYCGQFESANRTYIEDLVKSGKADVQFMPVAILDRSFSDKYSTRAGNAAAAVANYSPDQYFEFHRRLFANQPEEGGAGLTDDRLIAIAKAAGVSHLDEISSAIKSGRWNSWVTARTDEFTNKTGALAGADIPTANVGSTPTVLVDGKYYTGAPGDASAFSTFYTANAKS